MSIINSLDYILLFLLQIRNIYTIDYVRYSPFSSQFNNQFDYADAESYSANMFTNLYQHMNSVKREQNSCRNIPVPKTILNKKYFDPSYELMQHKYWYPPKDHQHVILWSQLESYRSSLFLSYSLQNDNSQFPPGLNTINCFQCFIIL